MARLDALEQVLTAAEAVLSAREDQMLTRLEWEALNDAVRIARGKMIFYVATLAKYVLVDAADEDEARRLAVPLLHDLHAEVRRKLGHDVPIDICTVRPATDAEIRFMRFHDDVDADEHEAR